MKDRVQEWTVGPRRPRPTQPWVPPIDLALTTAHGPHQLRAGSPQVEECRWLPDVAARRAVAVGSVRAVPRTLEMMEYACGSEQG